MYIVTQLMGCFVLAFALAYTRYVGFGIQSYIVYVAAQVMFVGWLLPYSYGHAPNLFAPWFIGTATMSIAGLMLNYFWFHDPISMRNWIGIIFILIGAYSIAT